VTPPDLVSRNVTAARPGETWVAGIRYTGPRLRERGIDVLTPAELLRRRDQ
jgi:hypothetical protein